MYRGGGAQWDSNLRKHMKKKHDGEYDDDDDSGGDVDMMI